MRVVFVIAAFLLAVLLGQCTAHAQITVVPINNGTGTLTSIPIPGGSNLAVTVATGTAALPLENIAGTTGATRLQLGDDSMAHVPLGFTFPFYGQNFNNSWMSSNGFVSFTGNIPGAGCCGGMDLRTLRDSRYNYMIAGIWTDLIDTTGNATWYKGNSSSMTYGWYGTKEFGTNNSNTFEININSTGALNVKFGSAFVSQNHMVTSGMAGNLANGEYYQHYYGSGFTAPTTGLTWGAQYGTGAVDQCAINPLSSPTCAGYQAAYTTQQCSISALYDPSCPGYQAAYTSQQCSLNPLYSNTCTGYARAYHDQQCSLNPLYATDCSGYAQAYHDQQCSLNSLYATDCPGYAAAYLQQQCNANPLYSTTCSGYAQAYHDQQCSISPLYANDCVGYAQAYFNQQCSINSLYNSSCPGYARAYHDQQCSINPLYMTDCAGYTVAYKAQQCSISALYATDCPGYAQAYFNQQCSLNGLYDKTCPNYATAYATKMLLEQQNMASTVATAGVVASTAPQTTTTSTTTTTVSSDGTISTPATVSSTGNTTVDKVISTPAPTANSAAAPAAAVQLAPVAPAATTPTAPQQQAQQDKKPEQKQEAGDKPAGGPSQMASGQQQESGGKEQPKTARQEIQEKRQEAAKKEAVEKGKNLANEMGKASDMESQKQVQNVVIQAMGYTPGFDQYNKQLIVQTPFYKPFTVYNNQVTVDNRRLGRGLFGPTDQLHNEMVDSQYNRGN